MGVQAHFDIDSEVLTWIDKTTKRVDPIRAQEVVELSVKGVLTFVLACILVEVIFIGFICAILGFTVTGKDLFVDFGWVAGLVAAILLGGVKCLCLAVQNWDGVGIILC